MPTTARSNVSALAERIALSLNTRRGHKGRRRPTAGAAPAYFSTIREHLFKARRARHHAARADPRADSSGSRALVPLAACEPAECDQPDEDDDEPDPEAPDDHQDDPDDHDDPADGDPADCPLTSIRCRHRTLPPFGCEQRERSGH